MCEVANRTKTEIWFNFPFFTTDDAAKKIVAAFKACTYERVHYELSNEVWNWAFAQAQHNLKLANGNLKFAGAYPKRYGYRAAQLMRIVRDGYGDSKRWSGILGTQVVWPENVTVEGINGANLAARECDCGLVVKDLFSDIAVTGYLGATPQGGWIEEITATSPAVVRIGSHPFSDGQQVRFNVGTHNGTSLGAAVSLHDKAFAIRKIDKDHFSIPIDASEWGAKWTRPKVGAIAYAVDGTLFDAMDKSPTVHPDDKYRYFRELYRDLIMAHIKTEVGWAKNVALAKAVGLGVISTRVEGTHHLAFFRRMPAAEVTCWATAGSSGRQPHRGRTRWQPPTRRTSTFTARRAD